MYIFRVIQNYLRKLTSSTCKVSQSSIRVEELPVIFIEAPIKRKYQITFISRARAEYRSGYKFIDD